MDGKKYEVGYPIDYSDVLVNKLRAAQAADNDLQTSTSSPRARA